MTGDLLTRPRGEPLLRGLVARLPRCYAVLGNHDLAVSRDPFSRAGAGGRARLGDAALRRRPPRRAARPARLDRRRRPGLARATRRASSADADLRILLSHYPNAIDRLEPGSFDLVLAGHMHDGQICIPYPGGKVRLAHLRARYTHGLYRRPGGLLHVSPGLGTTFVPFRFCARPEATELVLHSA